MRRKRPGPPGETPVDTDIAIRQAVFARFKLEDLQHLEGDELLAAQQLCGHGKELGIWETDLAIVKKCEQRIDLAKRIRHALSKLNGDVEYEAHADLISEAVQTLTRFCVLARLEGSFDKSRALQPSTVAGHCYANWHEMIAYAIRSKANAEASGPGLFRYLTEADRRTLEANYKQANELKRLYILANKGLWSDIPKRKALPIVTNPSSAPPAPKPQNKPVPHPPLPLDWLREIGPRVLWVVTELAPNLIRLLEALRKPLQEPDVWEYSAPCIEVRAIIEAELARNPWLDAAGQPLVPPFPLQTAGGGGGGADRFEWPIRTWEQVQTLSTTVQAAHAFVALLATAGRVSEDATLNRTCIEVHADGSDHVRGRTYKLNWAPHGQERTWPAPAMLVLALGQQARFAAAWDWLPLNMKCGGAPTEAQFGDQLWVSIGTSGNNGPEARFTWRAALMKVATRLGVTNKPGGKYVCPHRFRKTTALLAGIALWNSPLVLKQLLGHKDIEMTLHYILSDPGVREEAEKVMREMRVMHCAETLNKVREALEAGLPNPFGGIGGERLASAVTEHERRENEADRQWTTETPYQLANEYTMNGAGWRLGPGFICSKLPHEAGECQKGKSRRGEHGEPRINHCTRTCPQRVDLPVQIAAARRKRDAAEVCEGYLAIATEAVGEGNLLVAAHCVRRLNEKLDEWPELKAKYEKRSDMQAVVAAIGVEDEAEAEVANG